MTTKKDFEASMGNRVLNPVSKLEFNALLFSTQYTPEEFAKKMNEGSNAQFSVDCEKNGLNKWKYSANTWTGGYVYCLLDDNPVATGLTGAAPPAAVPGPNPLEAYFLQHPKQLVAFKYGVVYGLGFLVTYAGALVTNGLISQNWVPIAAIVIGVIEDHLKLLDPKKKWPGVGADAPKK